MVIVTVCIFSSS